MFTPSRPDARRFLFDTWKKYKEGQVLSGLEAMALETMLQHPEYHAILDQPDRYLDRDYLPEAGAINPFLHLSMHLAIMEQLSIDQPPGIRDRIDRLAARTGSHHDAMHEAIDCLGEMIWQAQRNNTAYDPAIYFECLDRKITGN